MGIKGDKGSKGEVRLLDISLKGEKGQKGDVGPPGAVGDIGAEGEKGDKGAKGINGTTGPQGEMVSKHILFSMIFSLDASLQRLCLGEGVNLYEHLKMLTFPEFSGRREGVTKRVLFVCSHKIVNDPYAG